MAIYHQDQLGWWSFLLGRVDESFESRMDDHYKSQKLRNTGRPWLSNLIEQLWDLQFNMWEHRNNVEHSDMTPAKHKQLEVLRTQATEEINAGCETMSKSDKHLFDNPDLIANYPLLELSQWLTDVRLARAAANNEFIQRRRSLARSRAFMRNWLDKTTTHA